MKPKIAIHKFSSCDGCQLAFLNLGEELLSLFELSDIIHFAEAGPIDSDSNVDISFVEGSISTKQEAERILAVRKNSQFVITIGACATSGGIQALRNIAPSEQWLSNIYARPDYIDSLQFVTPISEHIKVDLELWGCPINSKQILQTVRSLMSNVLPSISKQKVCMECKREQNICVMVTNGAPCMGPITQSGCGAICPRLERDCYGCTGPAENANTTALEQRFSDLGLTEKQISNRFLNIHQFSRSK